MEYNPFATAAAPVKKPVNTQCEFYLVTSEASSKPAIKFKQLYMMEMVKLISLKCSYLITCQPSRETSRGARILTRDFPIRGFSLNTASDCFS
jgi:hypothetical protein